MSSSSDSESIVSDASEDLEPKAKKKKTETKDKKEKDAASSSKKPGGEVSFQLSKMRFVSVSEFRGKKYVNIREYYEKDGNMLPGRKGIALNSEQWNKLKKYRKEIDEALEDL